MYSVLPCFSIVVVATTLQHFEYLVSGKLQVLVERIKEAMTIDGNSPLGSEVGIACLTGMLDTCLSDHSFPSSNNIGDCITLPSLIIAAGKYER